MTGAEQNTGKILANYIKAFVVMIAGILLGFAITAGSIGSGHGLGTVTVGPWTAWPRNGTMEIDPYARAVLARSGETPLGRDQGLVFIARTDSSGRQLEGGCEYRVSGPPLSARFWTLGVMSPTGALIETALERHGFTSSEVLRREGGAFEIAITEDPRPGNWLSAGGRPFILILRLYDTPIDIDSVLDPAAFPKIIKVNCA